MMRFQEALTNGFLLTFALCLCACSTAPPAPAGLSHHVGSPAPLLIPDSKESKISRSLIREQEGRLATCLQDHSCDRAHFTRALLSLSDNQDLAAKHFQEVMTISPKSPLARLSQSWLKLIQQREEGQNALFAQTTQWLIQDQFSREQTIKEEISTRDRKLEELSAQLEALKQIDVEMQEKPYRMKPKGQSTTQPN